jgi:hypothetical protein
VALGERVGDVSLVTVTRLAMRFPLPDDRPASTAQAAEHLFGSICSWSEMLSNWVKVAALGDLPLDPVTLLPSDWIEEHCGLRLQHVDQAGNETTQLARPLWNIGGVVRVKSLDERTWWAVVERVNAGVDPPAERLLLSDAWAQLEQESMRRAVLDAATAAEIALTQILDHQLRGLPPAVANLIRREARQLGPLARALGALGVDLPEVQELAEVRNQAIHRGRHPSPEEGRAAFLLVRDLVERARPLSDLLAGPVGSSEAVTT